MFETGIAKDKVRAGRKAAVCHIQQVEPGREQR